MIAHSIAHLSTSRSRKAEVVRYVCTGAIATAIQYGVYLMCIATDVLPAEVATVVSYCVSLVFNFVLTNIFTFRTKPNKLKAVSFTLSHMINLGLQTLLVWAFSHIVSEAYALAPAMLICIPINFFLVRFSVTNRRFLSSKEKEVESRSDDADNPDNPAHSSWSDGLVMVFITAVLLVSAVSVYMRAEYTFPVSDDLLYSFVLDDHPLGDNDYSNKVECLGDAIQSQTAQYFHSNGRTPLHVLVQMFAGPWGRGVFNLFVALMLPLTIALFVYQSAEGRHRRSPLVWVLAAISFLYLYQNDSKSWLSIAGCMNYLWPLTLTLVFLIVYTRLGINLHKASRAILCAIGILVSALLGWGMECYTLPLCAAILTALLFDRKSFRPNRCQWVMIVVLAIGAAILVLAPGNFKRAGTMPSLEFRITRGISYLLGTYSFWILLVTMAIMRFRGKGRIRRFYGDNKFYFWLLGWGLALGMVANTLPQSFNGISFFCFMLVFRSLSSLTATDCTPAVKWALPLALLVALGVHQRCIAVEAKRIYAINERFVNEYVASADGIMMKPTSLFNALTERYISWWFNGEVEEWKMLTISSYYTNKAKPLCLLDSLDYLAATDPDSFFTEDNRIKGDGTFYLGDKYVWRREAIPSGHQLRLVFFPLSKDDAGKDVKSQLWYYIKGNSLPDEQTIELTDSTFRPIAKGCGYVMAKPFKRRIKEARLYP